jgi:hypothetical protein
MMLPAWLLEVKVSQIERDSARVLVSRVRDLDPEFKVVLPQKFGHLVDGA